MKQGNVLESDASVCQLYTLAILSIYSTPTRRSSSSETELAVKQESPQRIAIPIVVVDDTDQPALIRNFLQRLPLR